MSSLERRTKAKFCLVERKGWNEVTVTDTERMRKTTDLNICRSTLRVSHGNRHQQDKMAKYSRYPAFRLMIFRFDKPLLSQ